MREPAEWPERVDMDLVDQDEIALTAAVEIATCQRCGAYWDPRQLTVCPCGGFLG
jgi:hypothetical protein